MPKSKKPEGLVPIVDLEGVSLETMAVRAGQIRSPELEHSEAIFPTSSFVFNSAEEAAGRFGGDLPGNIYARFTNPTVAMFEQRIAMMEGGESAVATASGMAAITATFMALLKSGDHVICSRSVFGTTHVLLDNFFKKFGVEVDVVPVNDYEAWRAALKPNTRLLFVETPSNPLCKVADIQRLAEIAGSGEHEEGALLIVDNCFCTPALQRPLDFGADIVIHSATKYLDGQGRCLGGVAIGAKEIIEQIHSFVRSAGPSMSPFNAWVFVKGLETLQIRMEAHCRSASEIAQWLSEQEEVEEVFYAGLPSHPDAELVAKQQSGGSGVLSFRVKGGREEAWRFINGVSFISITANLGDTKTTITHPATTTHGRLSDEAKLASGITENLIRLSIGLENVQDLKNDLLKGFKALAIS